MRELGLKDVFLICDKGFWNSGNLSELKENGISFLTPLKRNSSEIDYSFMDGQAGSLSAFGENVFLYHGRPIYYHVCQEYGYEKTEIKRRGRHPKGYVPEFTEAQKDLVVLFRDVDLMNDEQSSYSVAMVNREEGYDSEGMKKNEKYFGTIALSVNRDIIPQELFETYKERELIEDGNKAYKDVLDNFAANKQGTDAYKGWLFRQPYRTDALLQGPWQDQGERPFLEIFRRGCHIRRKKNHGTEHQRRMEREHSGPKRPQSLHRSDAVSITHLKSYGYTIGMNCLVCI